MAVERSVVIAGVVLTLLVLVRATSNAASTQLNNRENTIGARSDATSTLQSAPIRVLTRSLTGDTVHIGVGASPTVLAVFATWCRTCREEVPALNMLEREFGAHGAHVVALSMDEGSTERIQQWLKQYSASYQVARDSTGIIARSIGVVGVPELYLIDASGRVQWMRRGPFLSGLPELRGLLKKLTVQKPL